MSALSYAERLPVLQQIDLPHPYYFREMYLPQLTSGPSSLAWSPDSSELIYSMAGSLWRQKIGAEQRRPRYRRGRCRRRRAAAHRGVV